jgi:hypothetical protein
MKDEPLLPAAETKDLRFAEQPPHWIPVADDLHIGVTADRVFVRWTREPVNEITFGPRTWDRILRTIANERVR